MPHYLLWLLLPFFIFIYQAYQFLYFNNNTYKCIFYQIYEDRKKGWEIRVIVRTIEYTIYYIIEYTIKYISTIKRYMNMDEHRIDYRLNIFEF